MSQGDRTLDAITRLARVHTRTVSFRDSRRRRGVGTSRTYFPRCFRARLGQPHCPLSRSNAFAPYHRLFSPAMRVVKSIQMFASRPSRTLRGLLLECRLEVCDLYVGLRKIQDRGGFSGYGQVEGVRGRVLALSYVYAFDWGCSCPSLNITCSFSINNFLN